MHEVSEHKTKVIKESYGDRSSVLVPKKHGEVLEVLHGYLQDDCGSKLSLNVISNAAYYQGFQLSHDQGH